MTRAVPVCEFPCPDTKSGKLEFFTTALNFSKMPLRECAKCRQKKNIFRFINGSFDGKISTGRKSPGSTSRVKYLVLTNHGSRLCHTCKPPPAIRLRIGFWGKKQRTYYRLDLYDDDDKPAMYKDESFRRPVPLNEADLRRMDKSESNTDWDKIRLEPYRIRPDKGGSKRSSRYNNVTADC